MGKRIKVLKEISIWAVLITAVLNSFGFPVRKEVIPITQAIIHVTDQLETLNENEENDLELMHDFGTETEYEVQGK